jgi:hypothetical protein
MEGELADGSSIASLSGPVLEWVPVVQPKATGERCIHTHTHAARSDGKDTTRVILERQREMELIEGHR